MVPRLGGFRRLMDCRHAADRRRGEAPPVHRHARPLRDRAIVFTDLSTGLRRAALVSLNLDQLEPNLSRISAPPSAPA